jgi:hypothetical protein
MHTPPNPGRVAALLAVARKLELVQITNGAGYLAGSSIIVESDGAHGVLWAVVDGSPPKGFASRALAVETWTALRYGELDQDGALIWSGRRYLVLDTFDGARQLVTLAEIPAR